MTYTNIKTNYNKLSDIWEWYYFIRICISTKYMYFILPTKFGLYVFFETLTCYRKLVMQSQTAIKRQDRKQLLQSYYKVWQKCITKCVRYYKVRQVLQSATVITKWGVTELFSFFFFFLKRLFCCIQILLKSQYPFPAANNFCTNIKKISFLPPLISNSSFEKLL